MANIKRSASKAIKAVKLALKIPPPVHALTFGAVMWLVDKQVSTGQFHFEFQLPIAILIAVSGVALVITSMLEFRRASTTIDPFHPEEASSLVDSGVFRFSRNPMYLSRLLVLIAWLIWLGSSYNLAVLAMFVSYITVFQIKPEEVVMKSLFGEEFEQYCSKVRRWI
jgi:protein-S-isoprenylcysteine O-methyltransferase Ste14